MGSDTRKSVTFYAGGFLYNRKNQTVLLHLRDGNTSVNPHLWGFFGGTSEGDESPQECCAREWKEELGIVVSPDALIPLCDYLNTERNTWRYAFYLESDMPKEQMTLGEGADFDWIPLEKVFEYALTDKSIRDLKYFVHILKKGTI
jgi:8-oxo-dGTP pyrophosphatase MutT (NUDIX family)